MNIIFRMRLRCIYYFLRGFFLLRPVPHHSDYRCWSRGSCVSFIVMLLLAIGSILIIAFFAGRASAHEWYPADCCSGFDCAPMADERISRTPEGDYLVDGQWLFTRTEARQSLSGRYHACFPQPGKKPKCIFAPPDGS